MIHVVTAANRAAYANELDAMFADRKRIFVDRLGWDVPVIDGRYERDAFDTDAAIYLLDLARDTRVLRGSTRLLPTTGAHLLADLFPQLCERAVPTGEDVWEISRLCTAPELNRELHRRTLGAMRIALVEFGLLYGINRYTSISNVSFLSDVLAAGWECEPLGLPREIGGDMVGAIEIRITPATLQLFRQRAGLKAPLLEVIPASVAA